jgi:hypothetical protein
VRERPASGYWRFAMFISAAAPPGWFELSQHQDWHQMKIEPQILRHPLDQAMFGAAIIKFLVALAIVIALLSLVAAIAEAGRRRPTSRWPGSPAPRSWRRSSPPSWSAASRRPMPARRRFAGVASYYSNGESGNRTASGARFDDRLPTAAHRCLPFGTRLRVSAPAAASSSPSTIAARRHGPAACSTWRGRRRPQLGLVGPGVARVEAEVIQ